MTNEVAHIEILLITAKQVSEILSVSERTVYNLWYAGHLDSVKLGSSRRFSLDDVKKLAATGADKIEFAANANLS
jgi:excisionase family DNA binding protein